eukprot:scaffold14392_cov105-Skeletonema_dohrnii-CCMP3373.AAC.2
MDVGGVDVSAVVMLMLDVSEEASRPKGGELASVFSAALYALVTTIIDEAALREVYSAKRSLIGVDDSVPTYHGRHCIKVGAF